MALYALKKTVLHAALCVFICSMVWLFSGGGRVYAGFMAGFLGAAYLLASWAAFMRAKGKDIFAFLRRKREPEVPYFHRKDKGSPSRLRFLRERHDYDDDGVESPRAPDRITRARGDALAFLLCAALMLLLSFI